MNTRPRPTCSIPGCLRPHKARGWCRTHYERWQRTGDPMRVGTTDVDRLHAKIADGPGCWLWLGSVTSNGYGRFQMGGRHWMAHRASYTLLIGPIPDGLQLDHLCSTPACVRPDHLEPVTGRENTLRSSSLTAFNAAKTHCLRGHAFDEANTYLIPNGGGRACRECRREIDRRYKARRRGEVAA